MPQTPPPPPQPISEEPRTPDLQVSLSSFTEPVYTNGAVDLQVNVAGGTAEVVQLLDGDHVVGQASDALKFTWDTSQASEGVHELRARAQIRQLQFESAPLRVVVDRTPPRVIADSRQPSPNATTVGMKDAIRLRFSEKVVPSSLTAESVVMQRNAQPVKPTWQLSDDGQRLSIDPTQVHALAANMQLQLTSAITDLAGNALLLDEASWGWKVPGFLRFGNPLDWRLESYATGAQMVMDKAGNITVAWSETENPFGGTFSIFMKHWDGSSWRFLDNGPIAALHDAAAFSLALDSNGTPYVAWSQLKGDKSQVYVMRRDGNAWQLIDEQGVNPNDQTNAWTPSLTLDAQDRPVVAWQLFDRNSPDLIVSRWEGSKWVKIGQQPLDMDASKWVTDFAVQTDRNNNILVAWSEASSGLPSFAYVKRWDGAQWRQMGSRPLNISEANQAFDLRLQLDVDGKPTVAWIEYDYQQMIPHVKQWTGNSWVELGQLVSPPPKHEFYGVRSPSFGLDRQGRPVIALVQYELNTTSLEVRRWDGSSWVLLGNEPVVPEARVGVQEPMLVLDSNGTPILSWTGAAVTAGINDGNGNVVVAWLNR